MRIGFDAKRFFHNKTGLGNYSRDLVRILATYYPNDTFLLYNPKKSSLASYPKFENIIEIEPTGFWKKFRSLWRSWGVSFQLKKDTLTLYHGLSGEIPRGIPKNIKKVVTIHDLIFLRYAHLYSFADRYIHFLKFKYAAQNADKIVAISNQTKKDIITYLHIPEDKIKVIYQGCADAFKREYSVIEIQKVKEKFHLKDQFLLNVGTLEERKNALQIVKAIKNIDITLVLIGKKTNYYKQIETYCSENKLESKVLHIQSVTLEELAIIYQLATIFIYPSIFEGFGIPIIEALFSKTPVITNKDGVFPEAGGPDSIYIDPKNTADITAKIELLLQNEILRNTISEKGLVYAQRFTDTVIAKEMHFLYESILVT